VLSKLVQAQPKTATNAGYLRHIIDVGHFSVLEHASVSRLIGECHYKLREYRTATYSCPNR
jgi:thymidylate synthase (FAD)